MKPTIDDLYLVWLYNQVKMPGARGPSKTHWRLMRQLYTTEFIWFVPNDDNRAEDGRDLRYEFFDSESIESFDITWMDLGCSMLELLIAISRRLSFLVEGEPRVWFWELIENVGISLRASSDKHYNEDVSDYISYAMDTVIWRTYEANGVGGLFPIPGTEVDQRKIEIWQQLNMYLLADM